MSKPRLSQHAWQLLLALHRNGPRVPHAAAERHELNSLGMICYADGWKLTRTGKDLARWLDGQTVAPVGRPRRRL